MLKVSEASPSLMLREMWPTKCSVFMSAGEPSACKWSGRYVQDTQACHRQSMPLAHRLAQTAGSYNYQVMPGNPCNYSIQPTPSEPSRDRSSLLIEDSACSYSIKSATAATGLSNLNGWLQSAPTVANNADAAETSASNLAASFSSSPGAWLKGGELTPAQFYGFDNDWPTCRQYDTNSTLRVGMPLLFGDTSYSMSQPS